MGNIVVWNLPITHSANTNRNLQNGAANALEVRAANGIELRVNAVKNNHNRSIAFRANHESYPSAASTTCTFTRDMRNGICGHVVYTVTGRAENASTSIREQN